MPFVFQIIGQYTGEIVDLIMISTRSRDRIEGIEGIKRGYLFTNTEEGVASTLMVCESMESAKRVQEEVQKIMEEYDIEGFSSEFIFEVAETNQYQ